MNTVIKTLEGLKTDFNNELIKLTDEYKNQFIENEIKEIEKYIDNVSKSKSAITEALESVSKPKTSYVFDIQISSIYGAGFKNVFNEYRLKGIKLTDYEHTPKEVILQAHILVDYYNWLKELILELNSNPKKQHSDLNLEQKLLALTLLGADLQSYSKTHNAKVLGKNKVRSVENFEKLEELFENKTFESISNRIKKEINTLKQK